MSEVIPIRPPVSVNAYEGTYTPEQISDIERKRTLADWPWDPELGKPTPLECAGLRGAAEVAAEKTASLLRLGKPHGFDPGAIEQNVNDLARYKDMVNHPPHYTSHPSGVECIAIIEHMPYCRGAAIKYIWRAGQKQNELLDLEKAKWCIEREIARQKATVTQDSNDAGC